MDERKRILRKSRAQEQRTADRYGGTRQPGSGNGWMRKNDVRNDDYLFENKMRARADAKQITLKLEDLVGVVNNAAKVGRTGLLQFDLGGKGWIVMREDDFEGLIDG